ncbi:MarR family winged helix-turn-helix transcriptional regulator [Pararhodobacter sp. CCB-MM2]|uniref:MarR family winged helix-turn-helix transcriptional regulator n=1 Tax=Pararhodobacter sp. CCB-MM2 TaxID=1786003 RepID=UPI00082D39D2|nr:MarR family transcriptional regulator [Pararhodobacter sp. CCB-MM2]MCA2011550.1 MarR family transcriptional regulator [Cereibacter sphaeroides]
MDEEKLLTAPLGSLLTFRISRLNSQLNAQANRLLDATAGLTLTQWRIFALIDLLGPIPAAEIVRRSNSDKAQISRTVARMLADGLLEAAPNRADQRSTVLSMTPLGRATVDKARTAMRQRQQRLLGAMTEAEQATLFACFDKLDSVIADMEDEA